MCSRPLSRVQLFAALWTGAHELFCPWDFPDKNTGLCCYFLLQGIFPTWGSNSNLLHWQVDSFPLSYLESQKYISTVYQKPHFYFNKNFKNSLTKNMPVCQAIKHSLIWATRLHVGSHSRDMYISLNFAIK